MARHRILVLAPDSHGALGGIAQYMRDVLAAMSSNPAISEIVVLPRHSGDQSGAPGKVRYDTRCVRSSATYAIVCSMYAFRGGELSLVLCAHLHLLPVAFLIAKVRRVPLLLLIYGIEAWQSPHNLLTTIAAKRCRHVISISDLTMRRFQSWAPIGKGTATILPNAIHLEEYGMGPRPADLVDALGLKGCRVIMTLGRMSASERYKGFDEVMEAMPDLLKAVPDLVYLVAGDGDDRPRLQRKAAALGIGDSVVFARHVPESRKGDYFRLADLYVMPSYGEGFGFVVLEALACGTPVVVSTADGTSEAVRGGMLGELIDPKDTFALQAAILRGLAEPKQIPEGLTYFAFPRFRRRLDAILSEIAGIR